MSASPDTVLVADIGGTNARFALGRRDAQGAVSLAAPYEVSNDKFAGPEDAIAAYLREAGARPGAAAFAVAGPVRDGAARLTNRDWAFTTDSLRAATGADVAVLLNDFAAAALSLPWLPAEGLEPLGGPAPAVPMWDSPDLRVSVLAPGTGLGHAVLLRQGGALRALDTEGGHAAFAAWDDETWSVCRAVTARFGRCSLERLLSGPGLANIHAALTGSDADGLQPEAISARAGAGDADANRTLDLFCRILGAAAGDLALATGARCLFVFGGVAQSMAARLKAGGFRERFEAKGRFADYMQAIPTMLGRSRHAGLIGAAAVLCPDAPAITVEDA
jgi:glucokinase